MKFRFPGIPHMVGVSRKIFRDQLCRQVTLGNSAQATHCIPPNLHALGVCEELSA